MTERCHRWPVWCEKAGEIPGGEENGMRFDTVTGRLMMGALDCPTCGRAAKAHRWMDPICPGCGDVPEECDCPPTPDHRYVQDVARIAKALEIIAAQVDGR